MPVSGRCSELKCLSLWHLIFGVMASGYQKEVKLCFGDSDKTEKGVRDTRSSAFVYKVLAPLECEFFKGSDYISFISISSEYISEFSLKQ